MKTSDVLFKELVLDKIDINNPVTDFLEYPWYFFWFDRDGKHICEWDYVNEYFNFHYGSVWKVFEDKLNYGEIQAIMRSMVEEHFGLRGVTPSVAHSGYVRVVEKHFGLRGVTPCLRRWPPFNTLSDRIWECKSCGRVNERDFLAARNIKSLPLKIIQVWNAP